jgi:hypothetical protein
LQNLLNTPATAPPTAPPTAQATAPPAPPGSVNNYTLARVVDRFMIASRGSQANLNWRNTPQHSNLSQVMLQMIHILYRPDSSVENILTRRHIGIRSNIITQFLEDF